MKRFQAHSILPTHPIHGEGPWWDHRARRLWWIDMLGKTINWSRLDGVVGGTYVLPEVVGAVVGRSRGGVTALQASGVVAVDDAGQTTWLANIESEDASRRFNDAKCDPFGRLVAGSLSLEKIQGAGSLYVIGSDMSVSRQLTGLTIPNGLAWSEDGSRLHLVDSAARTVSTYDYDLRRGEIDLRPRSQFSVDGGAPDGMTIDVNDSLWIAVHGSGEVRCYDPEGTVRCVVELPVKGVTSCIFAGANLSELVITTSGYGFESEARRQAGHIFSCVPGTEGRPEPYFEG